MKYLVARATPLPEMAPAVLKPAAFGYLPTAND